MFRSWQIHLYLRNLGFFSYICYVQVEILYKLQLVQKACTSCNLYKQFAQVATHTRLAVQAVTCTEFHYQINPTCTILLYKLDLKRILVKLTILLKLYLILCVEISKLMLEYHIYTIFP